MSEEVTREVQTWDPIEWLDRIINGEQTYTLQEVPGNSGHYKLVPDNVEVIQKGTPLSQSRLNRMTDGISFSHNVIGAIAAEALRQAGLAHKNRQVDFEKRFLQGEATITGTPGGYFSTTYPFVLVPIPAGTEHTQTNTPHYDVTLCVTAADDIGKVNLEVYDKASNGFKVRNLGSAKSVSFTWTTLTQIFSKGVITMRIQHVNSGTKAKWKTKGTILQLTVPGVEPIEIDLNEELQDVAVTVDVSLNSGFTALEKGVGNWYVASVKIPAREYDYQPTGETDDEGYDILEEVALDVNMRDVTLCLWGIPDMTQTQKESEVK